MQELIDPEGTIKRAAKALLIIGAGGHGHVAAETAKALGYQVFFLDDDNQEAISKIDDLERFIHRYPFIFIAIGDNALRQQLTEKAEALGGNLVKLIHPSAYISPSASIAAGTIVGPMAAVNTNSVIGKGCIISIGAIVDHDVVVGPYAHLNAGSVCQARSVIEPGQKLEAGDIARRL